MRPVSRVGVSTQHLRMVLPGGLGWRRCLWCLGSRLDNCASHGLGRRCTVAPIACAEGQAHCCHKNRGRTSFIVSHGLRIERFPTSTLKRKVSSFRGEKIAWGVQEYDDCPFLSVPFLEPSTMERTMRAGDRWWGEVEMSYANASKIVDWRNIASAAIPCRIPASVPLDGVVIAKREVAPSSAFIIVAVSSSDAVTSAAPAFASNFAWLEFGLRVTARTLWPRSRRPRATAPPCLPVDPMTTTVSFCHVLVSFSCGHDLSDVSSAGAT